MRLIDSDEVKETARRIAEIPWGDDRGHKVEMRWTLDELERLIDTAPTIDIAEVCGECKPYEPCLYCKHEFENKFEAGGAKMDGGKE